MEQLPLDVQEIIYSKAYKMQYDDCLKELPERVFERKQKTLLKKHNDAWSPLFQYIDKLDGISTNYKRDIWSALSQIRKLDTDRILSECYNVDIDEKKIDMRLYRVLTTIPCQPANQP
jgi:hypothetical protein